MSEALVQYLDAFGYLALVGAGFAEYAGFPVATVPVLILAGALSSSAGMSPVAAAGSAALGGLCADMGWYTLIRWRGSTLVDAACGLTSNPNACVLGVEERVSTLGPLYVIPSKFIPGAGNLVGPAAGLARMPVLQFVLSDVVALSLWAAAYTTLGAVFATQIRSVIDLVASYQRWGLTAAAFLILAAAAWRGARVVRHRSGHEKESTEEVEVR